MLDLDVKSTSSKGWAVELTSSERQAALIGGRSRQINKMTSSFSLLPKAVALEWKREDLEPEIMWRLLN